MNRDEEPTGAGRRDRAAGRAPEGNRRSPLDALLEAAQSNLWAAWSTAQTTDHPGIVGDIRETAVRAFLSARLPQRFGVNTGELMDSRGTRSSQLDAIVSDVAGSPEFRDPANRLLPAEAALGVIEIKSVINRAELKRAIGVAESIRRLRPFGKPFVDSRTRGEELTPTEYRCFFSVVAFESDLGEASWLESEWKRVSDELGNRLGLIDRLVVLNRGLIQPAQKRGMTAPRAGVLWSWFVDFANFLNREARRRPAVDWARYGGGVGAIWKDLG